MKKIALLGVLALSMGFVSCDEVQDSNARPQENPQLPILEATGLDFTPAVEATEPVDLQTAEKVALANVEFDETFPTTYALQTEVQLSAEEDFSNYYVVESTVEDNVVYADKESLNAALRSMSIAPYAQTVKLRFAAYAVSGSAIARIGGPDVYYPATPITATYVPLPLDIDIEEAYYLVLNDEVETAIKLDHSSTNVYDDPVFSKALYITADQQENGFIWKIIAGSAYETAKANGWSLPSTKGAQYGPEVEDALEGELFANEDGEDAINGMFFEGGQFVFTCNMLDLVYSFKSTFPYLYTPGSSNGWNFGNSQLLGTQDFLTYEGYVNVKDMFKFTSEPAWNAPYNLGLDAWVNQEPDSKGWMNGVLRNGSNDNITVTTNGLYYVSVAVASLEFKMQLIETIGVIGGFNSWGESVALNPSSDNLVWTGEVTLTGSDQGWKFRANNDWTINLGGSMDDLVAGGDNLPDPGAGVYAVRLDLSKLPYTCTLTAK